MRAHHPMSVNRSARHLLVAFGFILLPLAALLLFSYISGISFTVAVGSLFFSSLRLFVAFLIATMLAWVLVVVLVRGKMADPALAFFDVMQSVPTFAILPLAVHFFGAGEIIIILFLVLTIVWTIIFSIVSALKQAERSWQEAIVVTKIKGFNYVRYYLLPLTAPGIVTGAIIGLGDGWEALVGTELLLQVKVGLGPFFGSFSQNPTQTLLGVLVFLSVVYTINKFVWLPLLEKSHELIEQ